MYPQPVFINAGSTRINPSVAVRDLKSDIQLSVELEIGDALWLKWPDGLIQRKERQELHPDRWQILDASPLAGAA
jgi:hypothetical protein